jgi:hypothetical protein
MPFCRNALAQPHNVNPRTITVDKKPAYPRAVAGMKRAANLWRFSPGLASLRFMAIYFIV